MASNKFNRRDFIKISAGATALGLIGSGCQIAQKNSSASESSSANWTGRLLLPGSIEDKRAVTASKNFDPSTTSFVDVVDVKNGKIVDKRRTYLNIVKIHESIPLPNSPNLAITLPLWGQVAVIFDVVSGKVIREIQADPGHYFAGHLDFYPKENVYVTVERDDKAKGPLTGVLKYRDLESHQIQRTVQIPQNPHDIVIVGDDAIIAHRRSKGRKHNKDNPTGVSVVDLKTGKITWEQSLENDQLMARHIAAASKEAIALCVFRTEDAKKIKGDLYKERFEDSLAGSIQWTELGEERIFLPSGEMTRIGESAGLVMGSSPDVQHLGGNDVEMSADGKIALTSYCESGVVVATDMTSGKPIKVIPGWQFGVAFPTGITLTPDKKFFLIADANSNVGFVSTSNLEPRIDMTVPVRIEPGFARRGVHLSSSELI